VTVAETGVADGDADSGTLLYVPIYNLTTDDFRTFVDRSSGAAVALPCRLARRPPAVSGRQMAFGRSDQQAADV
jgi:hypothetical protein